MGALLGLLLGLGLVLIVRSRDAVPQHAAATPSWRCAAAGAAAAGRRRGGEPRPAGRRVRRARSGHAGPGARDQRGPGHRAGLRRVRQPAADHPGTAAAGPAGGGAARDLARGGRQPDQRRPRRAVAAGGADAAGSPGSRAAARAVHPVRPGLPGDRPLRRVARRAQGIARRPGRRPGGRGAADGARGRRQRPRAGCCGRCRRSCARTRAPGPSSRPGRAGRSTPRGWRCAAPWVLLLLLSTQPSAVAAYNQPAGALVLLVGGGVSFLAYRVMLGIARLPLERRVLQVSAAAAAPPSASPAATGCLPRRDRHAADPAGRPRRPARPLPARHPATVAAARRSGGR